MDDVNYNDVYGIVNATAELQCSGLTLRHHLLESYDFEVCQEARVIVESEQPVEFIPQMGAARKPAAKIYITKAMRRWING
jgi:hypothetical protein